VGEEEGGRERAGEGRVGVREQREWGREREEGQSGGRREEREWGGEREGEREALTPYLLSHSLFPHSYLSSHSHSISPLSFPHSAPPLSLSPTVFALSLPLSPPLSFSQRGGGKSVGRREERERGRERRDKSGERGSERGERE
jgi:hypothetical protein